MTRLDSVAGANSFASRHEWPACTGRCTRGNCILTVRRNQCCFTTDAPLPTSQVAAAKSDAGSAASDPHGRHSQDSSADNPLTQGAPSTAGTDPMDDAGRAASIRHKEESYDGLAYEERYHHDTGRRGSYDNNAHKGPDMDKSQGYYRDRGYGHEHPRHPPGKDYYSAPGGPGKDYYSAPDGPGYGRKKVDPSGAPGVFYICSPEQQDYL